MCGRYSITLPPEAIRELFRTHGELPNWPAYYNAPPTTAFFPAEYLVRYDVNDIYTKIWTELQR